MATRNSARGDTRAQKQTNALALRGKGKARGSLPLHLARAFTQVQEMQRDDMRLLLACANPKEKRYVNTKRNRQGKLAAAYEQTEEDIRQAREHLKELLRQKEELMLRIGEDAVKIVGALEIICEDVPGRNIQEKLEHLREVG